MTPDSFDELLSLVGPHLLRVDYSREPISPIIRLGITLRFLAAGDSMTSLSYAFRVGLSTVSECIAETTKVIWTVLRQKVLPVPNQEMWRNIATHFEDRWQFHNCTGAIDGKHIQIQAPPNSGSEFYNYKGHHSIVLLAVADSQYVFTLVDVGASGRQSDGGIFSKSQIGQKLKENLLNLPPPRRISSERPELPYVFVGDEAFPLLTNLLRPFPGKTLDIEKRVYNYRLSRARLVIENTFGILSSRWRVLRKPIIAKLENVDNIVKASVSLHNYLMLQKNNRFYFTPDLVDRALPDNTILPGAWRQEGSIFQSLGRCGSNNHGTQATYTGCS
ncbi:hypothetical protein NQ315_012955 [Exocentrus adspersus]|uniref:DDE Tnp4 domain-containing protein n=1 Tax=Exocentrus adspersus TaxID=1586481 RepID=A0AAV8VTI8_9CUCU|nr:hypothetical protein NQ315_012955 [Exocentrus adspersus]